MSNHLGKTHQHVYSMVHFFLSQVYRGFLVANPLMTSRLVHLQAIASLKQCQDIIVILEPKNLWNISGVLYSHGWGDFFATQEIQGIVKNKVPKEWGMEPVHQSFSKVANPCLFQFWQLFWRNKLFTSCRCSGLACRHETHAQPANLGHPQIMWYNKQNGIRIKLVWFRRGSFTI